MAKDSFWFRHDYNARNDEKILELMSEYGAEAYGIYWMLIESMAENENGCIKASLVGGLSHGFRVAKSRLIEIIQCCIRVELLHEKDGNYFSNRLLKHKEERRFFSEKGREGAERKREKNRGALASLNRGKDNTLHNITEIKKGKEFSKDMEFVFFEDGSKQKLGTDQKNLLKMGELKPKDITKGLIN